MTILSFPLNPLKGQRYFAANGKTYFFDGVKWGVTQPTPEPVVEPTPEPATEPTVEPTVESDAIAMSFASFSDPLSIQFPANPTAGASFVASNGSNYVFDGEKWVVNQNVVIDSAPSIPGVSNYVLPIATNTRLGGVRIGGGITNQNGTISIDTTGSLKGDPGVPGPAGPAGPAGPQGVSGQIATANSVGTVKIGANINVNPSGEISVPAATATTLGVVKPGTNVAIDANGAINVNKGAGINTVKDIPDVNSTAGGAALNDGALLIYNASNERWDTVKNLRSNEMDGGFF